MAAAAKASKTNTRRLERRCCSAAARRAARASSRAPLEDASSSRNSFSSASSSIERLLAFERRTNMRTGAMQARADRPDGHPEHARDLGICELGPGEEEQHVSLLSRQRRERIRNTRLLRRDRPATHVESSERAQSSFLVAVVATHEVVRDPEQPWPSLPALRVVARPCRERPGERLGRQLATEIWADTAREVAVDRVELPLEQLLERFRSHTASFPQRPRKFVRA